MASDNEHKNGKLQMIAGTSDLEQAIYRLEQKELVLEQELGDLFHSVLESLKPTNIIKNTVEEIQESTPLKHNLVKVAIGLGVGYLSNKLLIGKSAGIVKKALGTALQFGITSLIAKKSDSSDSSEKKPEKKKNLFQRILSI